MIDTNHTLQFFTYAHLPEHLQTMSKPFAVVAHKLADMSPEELAAERELILASQGRNIFNTLIGEIDRATPANYQATRAVIKIAEAKTSFARNESFSEILNLLLEAKDCAVRALLFKLG